MNKTAGEILELPRERAIEAALALGDAIPTVKNTDKQTDDFLRSIGESPYKNIEDIEAIVRIFLLAALEAEQTREKATQAVRGSGQKAFVFGGTELVMVASIAVLALHVIISKGKSSQKESGEVTKNPDGSWSFEWKKETRFGISGKVADLIESIRGGNR